jgi:hypothetical protein
MGKSLSSWTRFKAFIFGVAFWLFFKTHWIQNWSKTYQWLWQRNKRTPIPQLVGWHETVAFTRELVWIADGFWKLWDIFPHPEYVQWAAANENGKAGDCSAFAVWLAAALGKSIGNGDFPSPDLLNTQVMSIGWIDAGGLYGAHNVCLIKCIEAGKIIHYWMDYGYPIAVPESVEGGLRAVAQAVVDAYAPGGVFVAWAVTDWATLRPVEVHVV